MPDRGVILQNAAGERQFFYDEQVQDAMASGWAPAGQVAVDSAITGDRAVLSPEQFAQASAGSVVGADPAAERALAVQAEGEARYGGLGQNILAAGEGALSALTLSGSDWALDAMGADTAQRAEFATTGRMIGEGVGTLATLAVPGAGAANVAKAGTLGKLLAKTPAGVAARFGPGGGSALARVARTAGEGAAYGLAQASTNIALSEPGAVAEGWASELGQGALLGAALGAGGGLIGEGMRGVSKLTAPKPAVIDFSTGPAKVAVEELSKSVRTVDDMVRFAADDHAKVMHEAKMTLAVERGAASSQHVQEMHAAVTALRPAAAPGTVPKYAAEHARADKLYERAVASGKEVHALEYLKYVERSATKAGATDVAKAATARLDDFMARSVAADEKLAGMAVKFPKADHAKVFDLLPDEAVGPDAFKRLIKLADSNPAELTKRAGMLDDYYRKALDAAKGNEVVAARIQEAMGTYRTALDSLVDGEAQKLLSDPKMLASILGVEALAEVALPEGPAKDVLQLAAAYKLVGGLSGARKLMGRGKLARIANAIGRRAAAGLGSGVARDLQVVKGLGSGAQTAVVGGAAGGAYEGYNWAQRLISGRGGGATQAALLTEGTIKARMGQAVDALATGKVSRAVTLPTTTLVLDRLLGEESEKAKSAPEKFKVIQERLSKYSVAPDAIGEKFYQLLKPIEEASEQIADALEVTLGIQLSYLQQKLPKDPGTMMSFGKSMWQPTDRELYEFSVAAAGVCMPLETVEMIANGSVPPQAAEALAATNPEIFRMFQRGVMERADEIRENSKLSQRIALGLAFQVPLEPTADPRYVAFVQSQHADKTMQQAAGQAGESKTPEESYSDAQKLLS